MLIVQHAFVTDAQAQNRQQHGSDAALAIPENKEERANEEQSRSSEKHRQRIRQKRNQDVTNENRSNDAPDRADGGEPSDVAADARHSGGQYPDHEWADHGQETERRKEEKCRGDERPDGQRELQAPIGDWLNHQNCKAKIGSGDGDRDIKPVKVGRAINEAATSVVARSQSDQRHCNLGRPDEMRSADVRSQHFRAENLNDHDRSARDSGSEVEIAALIRREDSFYRSNGESFHGHVLLLKIRPSKVAGAESSRRFSALFG